MKIDRVASLHCGLGEGAVWDDHGKVLCFLDFFGKKVFRYDPASGETQNWPTPGPAGALALREGGGDVYVIDGLGSRGVPEARYAG